MEIFNPKVKKNQNYTYIILFFWFRGVPLSKTRTVILDIFKRKYENNDFEYEVIFKTIFKENVPQNFKNIPSFANSTDVYDVLTFHVLNENGIKVDIKLKIKLNPFIS